MRSRRKDGRAESESERRHGMDESARSLLQIQDRLRALEFRFDSFETLLADVARRGNGRIRDPRFIPLSEAAGLLGLRGRDPVGALRKRIQRVEATGFTFRRRRGGVNRQDFNAYIEKLEEEK